MFTTQNQQDFKAALKQFNADKHAEYGSYAFSAGYMESLLVEMLDLLPKRKQKEFIAQIQQHVADKIVTVENYLTGDPVDIRRGDRGTCVDPSMERYHNM